MELLKLFSGNGTAETLIFLSITGALGVLLGRIKYKRVKLGVAGVLFAGLLIAHLGAQIDGKVLHFAKGLGLTLFVYSIGLEVGPRFITSLRANGLKINFLVAGIVFTGFFIAIGLKYLFDIPTEVITGIMCGSVTNTPSLGAAQQIITEQMTQGAEAAELTAMGYAVAYPFGIIGTILTMVLLRVMFNISRSKASYQYKKELTGRNDQLQEINIKINNANLYGKTIAFLQSTLGNKFVISRLERDGDFLPHKDEEIIQEGDILYGVSRSTHFKMLTLNVGTVYKTKRKNISGQLAMRHVMISNKKLAGKTIKEIGISRRYPASITRIFRGETELLPSGNNTVEFGDTVRIVGERNILGKVADKLGNSVEQLSHPNTLPIFLGVLLGIVVGSIPIVLPGLPAPAKLGMAGGPLLVALLLGHKGRIGKVSFYMTPSSKLYIRELGIILFLSCVGLSAGRDFATTLVQGGYMWILYGGLITFLPILIVGIIAHKMKINYLTICGFLAGSMTDPQALEFANSIAPGQAQSTAYATVYPFTMFLRVLMAQILVLLLL